MTMEAMVDREDKVRMVEWSRKSSQKCVHRYSLYLLQDLMAFKYMSMRDLGKMGASIPAFARQHETESAGAFDIVGHS
jgi:hypothetical protein